MALVAAPCAWLGLRARGAYQTHLGPGRRLLGWAMTGACLGPMYALIGSGTTAVVLAVVAGVLGVLTYATLRDKLLN